MDQTPPVPLLARDKRTSSHRACQALGSLPVEGQTFASMIVEVAPFVVRIRNTYQVFVEGVRPVESLVQTSDAIPWG